MGQMRHTRQQDAKLHSMQAKARYGQAAKTHSMIASLAANEALPVTFTAAPMICECQLKGGVDGFGPRAGQKHMIKSRRCNLREPIAKVECERMPDTEARRIVELTRLFANGFDYLRVAVTNIDTP